MSVQSESSNATAANAGRSKIVPWLAYVPWLLLVTGLAIQISDPGGVMSSVRNLIWDYYQRQSPRPYVDTAAVKGVGVRYVDIDEESLKAVGQWPWSRKKIAELVDRLRDAGAATIAFDINFTEPDRTTPALWAENLSGLEGEWSAFRDRLLGLPSHESILAAAIATVPTVTGMILTDGALDRKPELKVRPAVVGGKGDTMAIARGLLHQFKGAQTTLPELEEPAAGNGAFNTVSDADNVIRRVPVLLALGDMMVPAIAAEALRVQSRQPRMAVKLTGASDESDFGGAAAITAIKAGAYTIPTTAEGEMWIHYTAAVPSRRIPAGAVFDRTADPALIKDAIIFIGTTAAGLRDIRATPMDQNTPGVEVHAMAVEQILLNHHLMRPDYALGVEIVFSAVLGVLVLVLLRRVSPAWTTGVTVAGVAAATAFSWFGFTQSLLLFDPIGPTVVLGLVFVSSMLFRFLQTEDERRWVRTAMAQYLPPSVVEEVARDPSKLKLGGESRELTVMFCDIRGFTSIAEHFRTDPAKLTHLINRVLTPLSQSVLDTKGTIDKYIGDCIMAFWNAPLDDPHHPIHACECALVMQDKLKALNAQLDAEGFYAQNKVRRIAVGIGMNSGPCVVGNMGSDQRFDYSALGDAVNLAARYQNLSGQYGSYIVVGEDTVSRIPDAFAFLEIDFVVVKGRATPARLFALMGPPQARQTPAFQALEAVMQDLFKAIRARDWDAARAAIARGRALDGVDKTIFDTYEQRISTWALQPAPDNWTGAWVAMEK